tara:strand:+ start:1054 stop:1560 length:507 start_codon:yes stop_codon:yes gene_type:complete
VKWLFLSLLFIPSFLFAQNLNFINNIVECSDSIQTSYSLDNKIPKELIVAQAIIESNWGKSRFAVEGNNYFGMRTWDLTREHLKPKENPDSKFGLLVYSDLCSSVEDYIKNLNTSDKYSQLRRIRTIELTLWGKVSALALAKQLENYSEERELYIRKIINQIKNINLK